MESWKQQGSPEWMEKRQHCITATDSTVIMGLSPWENEYNLWRRKLGLLPPVRETEAMIRGRELEPMAREEFFQLTGIEMHPDVVIHPDYPWAMASLDGINEARTRILEIKCGGQELHEKARAGTIDPHYFCQMQWQLFCSETHEGYFMSFRDGEGIIIEVERNQAYIDEMIPKCLEFYRRLREFDPPAPKHEKREGPAWRHAVDQYELALDMMRRAEAMVEEYRKVLVDLSEGENVDAYGLKVTHYIHKGNIDYSAIPELKGKDLECYRKPPTQRTRVSL